jgi:hypothetical protein
MLKKHDKLFQHRIVGAMSTSAPNSKCFKCLQKDISHIFYGSKLQKILCLGCVRKVESSRPFHSK